MILAHSLEEEYWEVQRVVQIPSNQPEGKDLGSKDNGDE